MRSAVILFYIVVFYIFTSFIWWTYLLMQKNRSVFSEQVLLMEIKLHEQNISLDEMYNSSEYLRMEKEYKNQQWMVIGESVVFLVLILFGAVQLRRTFVKEFKLNRQQKNFLLSITHELRSPLASTKVTLQTLQKHRDLPQHNYHKLIENGLNDVARLQTLVENLLLATKIEDHSFKPGNEYGDLSVMVTEVVNKFQESNGQGRKVISEIQQGVTVMGDTVGLQSVIMNLVENADKYSPAPSVIHISLQARNKKAVFTVSDEGAGIPEKERTNIFKKFYRIGNEETRRTKGTGLGLYIVDKIVALHKGKVSVKNNSPSGSVFEVEIPIA